MDGYLKAKSQHGNITTTAAVAIYSLYNYTSSTPDNIAGQQPKLKTEHFIPPSGCCKDV